MLVAVKQVITEDECVKAPELQSAALEHRLENVLLEVQTLLHYPLMVHRNIVKLLGYGWDGGAIPFLVLECVEMGSLAGFLQSNPQSWESKYQLTLDVTRGLKILHECDISQGDVKVENVLVFRDPDKGFIAKLADFGLCCIEGFGSNAYKGTPLLQAPELRSSTESV
jgi:serine/threonine protein kinase